MIIGIPVETRDGETRVAATPETVKKFIAAGHEVTVQSGAGVRSSIPDEAYAAVGASIGQRAVAYSSLDLLSSLADEEAFERFARPQSTPFWSLPNQIQRIEDAGFASTAYRLRLQQLLATPLVFAAMSILAAAFSLRLMRLGDLARMSVAAVVLGFAFFFLNQFSSAMGSAEVVPPLVAAWLPPLLTALAAFTLLFYTEDG